LFSKCSEQKRKAVVASVEKVTQLMVDNLNSGVAHVFANQKKIEQEVQKLDHQATKLNKQTANWIKLIEDFNNALKVSILPFSLFGKFNERRHLI